MDTYYQPYQGEIQEYNGSMFYLDHPTHYNNVQGSFAFEITLTWAVNRVDVTYVVRTRTLTGSMTPSLGVTSVADLHRLVISYAKEQVGVAQANVIMLNVTPNKPINQLT